MIGKMRHQDATQRAGQIAGHKNPEALQQAQPFRHIGREKQLAEGQGEKHENDEIIDFQRPTQGRQPQSSIVGARKTRRDSLSIGRHKYAQNELDTPMLALDSRAEHNKSLRSHADTNAATRLAECCRSELASRSLRSKDREASSLLQWSGIKKTLSRDKLVRWMRDAPQILGPSLSRDRVSIC